MAVSTTMDAGKRRMVYGFNVVATSVLAVVVTGLAIWAAGRFGGRVDLSSEKLNSLSPRTVQLLKGLDQNITLTGLYSTALKEIRPYAEKHKEYVADLLDLYETAGHGKVTTQMIDASESPAKVTELLKRLTEKPAYKNESAPHAEALGMFPPLKARLAELTKSELAEIERLAGADRRAAEIPQLAIIQRNFQVIGRDAESTDTDVKTLETGEIPRYGQAVEVVRDFLKNVQNTLQDAQSWMTVHGKDIEGIAPETSSFFAGAGQRYADVQAGIADLLQKTEKLERVKLEELYDKLKRDDTVLVETPEEAQVLSQDDVWPWRMDRDAPAPPDGDPRDFAGEQAVSSAILQLTQKDKTAVIFTRFGGQPLLEAPQPPPNNPFMQSPQAPYGILKDLLEKENLVAEEWDVKTQNDPPTVKDASRVIYVVFPPEPPEEATPMRPAQQPPISAAQKQRILDAVKASGMAVFLTPWAPPQMPYLPAQKYEFKDYLKTTWGIEVEDSHLALAFAVNPQTEGLMYPSSRNLLLDSEDFHFTNQPIGKPLQSVPTALQAVAPLKIVTGEQAPKDVSVEPIAEVNATEDVWAITNLNRINEDLKKNQGTRRYEDDIPAPFPVAVAATNADGKKLVVFASDTFVSDSVLNMARLVQIGGALRLAKIYPGNTDLFINALHWLTGNADRIAVGPKRGDVPRLDKLTDGATLTFTRWFLVAIWPGLALLVGAVVWLARRR